MIRVWDPNGLPSASDLRNDSIVPGYSIKDALDALSAGGIAPPGADTNVVYNSAGTWAAGNGLTWHYAGALNSLGINLAALQVPSGKVHIRATAGQDNHVVQENMLATDIFGFNWYYNGEANGFGINYDPADIGVRIGTSAIWDALGRPSNLILAANNVDMVTVDGVNDMVTIDASWLAMNGEITFNSVATYGIMFTRGIADGFLVLPQTGLAIIGSVRVTGAGAFEFYNGLAWVAAGGGGSLQQSYDIGGTITPTVAIGDIIFNVNINGSFNVTNGTDSCSYDWVALNQLRLTQELFQYSMHIDSTGTHSLTIDDGDLNFGTVASGSINFTAVDYIDFIAGTIRFADLNTTIVEFIRNPLGDARFVLPEIGTGALLGVIGQVRVNAAGAFQWYDGAAWQTAISAAGAASLQASYLGGNTITTTVAVGNVVIDFAPNSTGSFIVQNGAQSFNLSYNSINNMNLNATLRNLSLTGNLSCNITGGTGATLTSTIGQTNVTAASGNVAIGATSGNVNISTTTSGHITLVPAAAANQRIGLGIVTPLNFVHIQDAMLDTTVVGIRTRAPANTGGGVNLLFKELGGQNMLSFTAYDAGIDFAEIYAGTNYKLSIGANGSANAIQIADTGTLVGIMTAPAYEFHVNSEIGLGPTRFAIDSGGYFTIGDTDGNGYDLRLTADSGYIDFTVIGNFSRFTDVDCFMHYTVSYTPVNLEFTYDHTYAIWYDAPSDLFNIKARNGAAFPAIPFQRDLHTATYEAVIDPLDEILIWDTSVGAYRKTLFQDFNPRYRWFEQTVFVRVSNSQFTVVDNPVNAAIFVKGVPIRYDDGAGTTYYGLVYNAVAAAGNITITIAGALMPAGVTTLEYGDKELVQVVSFAFNGEYADAGDNTLLASDLRTAFKWTMGEARVVMISHIHDHDDTTVQPKVNASVGALRISTSNLGSGKSVTTSWTDTDVDIDTTNYILNFGDYLEVSADVTGTGDAANLTTILTIITK
jgi:hypothetical protein